MSSFTEASRRLTPPDPAAAAEAQARHDRLTKPPGSLGRLEDLGAQLSSIAGRCPPPVPEPAAVVIPNDGLPHKAVFDAARAGRPARSPRWVSAASKRHRRSP